LILSTNAAIAGLLRKFEGEHYIRLVLISNQTNVRCGDTNFFNARGTKHRSLRCGFLHMSASATQMMTVLFSGFTQPDSG
ncbi:hypothetical protein, partial [Escherichia fergusonii]|uniref:hypothetical protein n=1 Tax=Escherichia fergusonii TaxID=564 RepID=UPI001C5C8953